MKMQVLADNQASEVSDSRQELTALVGGCGEALVGPLSPLAAGGPDPDAIVAALRTFVGRAVGAP